MLTIGVALFATFSGFLANTFLSASRGKRTPPEAGGENAALRDVERLLEQQERTAAALRARIAELEPLR